MLKQIVVFHIIVIALFSTAISGLFGASSKAQAIAQSNTVMGSGSAAPVLINSGNFGCIGGPSPMASASYELHFAATHIANWTLSGVWDISVFEETGGHILGGEQHGILTGGSISPTGYNLTGEITFDNLCSTNPLPVSMNITGQCESSVNRNPNVEIRSASNETGSFLATVFCSP